MNAIQRFIKPKGPRAFINRSIWRKNGQNQAWMITNKVDFTSTDPKHSELNKNCTNLKNMNSCSIIQIKTGKNLEETCQYLENIVKFFEEHRKLRLEEIVGDFIKDDDGVWWLINIKGFKINNHFGNEKLIDFTQDFTKNQDIEVNKLSN